MNDDQKKHQSELAASGYRLPDSAYVAPANTDQASTEEQSGDGGKNAAFDPADSPHGFKGELTSAADASRATLERSAQAARAARNDRETPAEVGLRVATEGHIAVGATQRRTAAAGAALPQDPRAGDTSNGAGSSSGDVVYASSAAGDAAKEAGLTAADFVGVPQTGANGYTKADVEAAVAKKNGGER